MQKSTAPKAAAARVLFPSTSSDDRPSHRSNEAAFLTHRVTRVWAWGGSKRADSRGRPRVGQLAPPIRLAGNAFKWTASNRVLRSHVLLSSRCPSSKITRCSHARNAACRRTICRGPRWPPKMYHLWPVENVPGVGGHLKVYHPVS
jgi:hypothetical protein